MILPLQKLSMNDKLKRHPTTGKNNIEETIDFYINSCSWSNYTKEILGLYRAVEGYIDPSEYETILNPFNHQNTDGKGGMQFNAVLKNFNILKGIVNLLLGEFGRRSHEYMVTSINPSDEISFKDGLDLVLKNYNAQAIANTLASMQFDFGQTVRELPPLEQYISQFKSTFDENRIISGQEILDYIKFAADLDNKYIDLFYDWVVTGGFYSYKKVNHDEVTFEVVPRHELFVPIEKHSRFIEDYSYAVRRQILPVYKVVDLFRGRIDEAVMDALEKHIQNGLNVQFADIQMTGRNGLIRLPTVYTNNQNFNIVNTVANGVELYHVVYKTWRPYYVLTYIDEVLGIESMMEVGEDYKLNKEQGDIKLEKHWENIIYQGYKCLNFYLDCGPLLENRADLNQEGLQKLPYNGIIERSIINEIQSIVKDGLPYQRSINVLKYHTEKLINKNKDKLVVMPYGLVPKKKGIDVKTQMYHADATSILWVDETAPNAAIAGQMIKTLDMSLGTYIKDTRELIQSIKQDYWDSIGMNNQRYSDIGDNAGKGTTEQAISRSALITAELVRQFEMVMQKDYAGLLDLSKLAYINGKKAKYLRSDGSSGFLNMNQDGSNYHTETSYNVFIRDSNELTEGIRAMRAQATNLIQNSGSPAILGHLYATNNITKLTKIIEKVEENKRQYDALIAKQQQDAAQSLEDTKQTTAKIKDETERYKSDNLLAGVMYTADTKAGEMSSRDLARPDSPLEEKLAEHQINHDNAKLALEEKNTRIKQQSINTNKK